MVIKRSGPLRSNHLKKTELGLKKSQQFVRFFALFRSPRYTLFSKQKIWHSLFCVFTFNLLAPKLVVLSWSIVPDCTYFTRSLD